MVTGATLKGFTSPGGYAAVSGWGPASGLSGIGSLSGPWYVEKQQLNFRYKRVPRHSFIRGHINLSSLSTEFIAWGTTMLVEIYDVNYKVVKIYDDYSTSTYTQPQRFTVYSSSADETGMSYGTHVAGTLNVEGNIVTTQDWYFRRLWVEGVDEEVAVAWTDSNGTPFMGNGYNYHAANSYDCSVGPPQKSFDTQLLTTPLFWDSVADHTQWDNSFRILNGPHTAFSDSLECGGNVNGLGDVDESQVNMTYTPITVTFLGGYSTSQDTVSHVSQFVDEIGTVISAGFDGTGNPTCCKGIISSPNAHQVRNKWYQITRHYWGA